jgi:AraC-like DNA-binding protein
MDFTEKAWHKPDINILYFSKALGYSKSQLYRKLISLTGKSPNSFLKDYRLNQSLKLLHQQSGNISEVAYESGFNSLAYFSECFKSKFGLLPSKYIQQHTF